MRVLTSNTGAPGAPKGAGRWVLAPLLAALVLSGCVSNPSSTAGLTDPTPMPVTFKEGDGRWAAVPPADVQPRGEWWAAFADPEMSRLVTLAGKQNNDIQVAAARLKEAQALLRTTNADKAVQVNAGGGLQRAYSLDTYTNQSPLLGLSYEVDLFGKLDKASQAASLDAQSREALLQSTRLLVQANVAQTYLQLRALDEERQLVRDTVAAYQDTLTLTEQRYDAGDVPELDVVRVRAEVSSTESDALALDRQRAALEHALAVLTGSVASTFTLPVARWQTALPVIPAGVPSTVLARRPDVAAAQRTMKAAEARVGVAERAWFPDINLTGSAGFASTDLADLFTWSARSWGIGALLSLPVFDGGRRQAGVDQANAQLQEALASYREQVLVAFRDVEDQLSALRLLDKQAQSQALAVQAAERATAISDARYRDGFISQLDLLDARRSELSNRRQALQVRSEQYQATVALIRAIGGSWEASKPAVAAQQNAADNPANQLAKR
ncbi:efflux transporter outer membrane subunit [Pokkaliibacter plantistimulans]|uniref:RND transporter n=1 Tax=Proteobacteria bacterium 228 TaxID=2083153 RepID=A0A2S5KNU3_9PROT|nr:efflux transporter outer membrane subunit [Pokkaliibacter plantistimulans]PPC76458.1 RND transporter [Pokkaliibacter plantistimulans]